MIIYIVSSFILVHIPILLKLKVSFRDIGADRAIPVRLFATVERLFYLLLVRPLQTGVLDFFHAIRVNTVNTVS